jgi:hypothetical protein
VYSVLDNIIVEFKNDVMAEIHVQAKKNKGSSTWLWILIALLIAGAIAYLIMRNNRENGTNNGNTNKSSSTSYIQQHQADRSYVLYLDQAVC